MTHWAHRMHAKLERKSMCKLNGTLRPQQSSFPWEKCMLSPESRKVWPPQRNEPLSEAQVLSLPPWFKFAIFFMSCPHRTGMKDYLRHLGTMSTVHNLRLHIQHIWSSQPMSTRTTKTIFNISITGANMFTF